MRKKQTVEKVLAEENASETDAVIKKEIEKSAEKAGRWKRSIAQIQTSLNPRFTEPIRTPDGKRSRRTLIFPIDEISPVRRTEIKAPIIRSLVENLIDTVRSSLAQKIEKDEKPSKCVDIKTFPLVTETRNDRLKIDPNRNLVVSIKRLKTDTTEPPKELKVESNSFVANENLANMTVEPEVTEDAADNPIIYEAIPINAASNELIEIKPTIYDTSDEAVFCGGSSFSSSPDLCDIQSPVASPSELRDLQSPVASPSELRDLHQAPVSPSAVSIDSGKAASIVSGISAIEVYKIYWHRYKKFIYWPSIVLPDAEGNWKNYADGKHKIHIRYFCDNGRFFWSPSDQLVEYQGYVKYEQFINFSLQNQRKAPTSKLTMPQSSFMRLKWLKAIEEAKELYECDFALRERKFFEMVEQNAKKSKAKNMSKPKAVPAKHTNFSVVYMDTEEENKDNKENLITMRYETPSPISPAFSPVKRKPEDVSKSVKHTPSVNTEPKQHLRRSLRRLSLKSVEMPPSPPVSPTKVIQKPEKKKEPVPVKSVEEVVSSMMKLDSRYLFKGVPKAGPVCKYCWKPGGKLQHCSKWCSSWLHASCNADESIDPMKMLKPQAKAKPKRKSMHGRRRSKSRSRAHENETPVSVTNNTEDDDVDLALEGDFTIVCRDCVIQELPACFVCKVQTVSSDLLFCEVSNCGKAYHASCRRYWPQSRLNGNRFRCASHMCHNCVSDDPRGGNHHLPEAQTTRCILCPSTYHSDSSCIPAGTMILTASDIVCPRHVQVVKALNASWCFSCAQEKSPEESSIPDPNKLLCCDTCPLTIHKACAKTNPSEAEVYICEECESGKLLMYLEVVWTKYRAFRWWPAIIVPPEKVPDNIMEQPHEPLEFVVWFLGTYDYVWLSRRRCYGYIDEDRGRFDKGNSKRKTLDAQYVKAVAEASKVHPILKEAIQKLSIKSRQIFKPAKYVPIRKNHGTYPQKENNEVSKCNCTKDMDRPCGPDSDCLNRCLSIGCPKNCPAGERCENQMFDGKNPLLPHLETRFMQDRGFGLVTKSAIQAGTFVIEYVGEIISEAEYQRRKEIKRLSNDESYYFLTLHGYFTIDAEPRGNLARFMNHSCDPNCQSEKWVVNGITRVGLFAVKDIPPNTELTFNYNWQDDDTQLFRKKCCCGSSNCSGILGIKPKEKNSLPKTATLGKMKPLKRLNKKGKFPIKIIPAPEKRRHTVNVITKVTNKTDKGHETLDD